MMKKTILFIFFMICLTPAVESALYEVEGMTMCDGKPESRIDVFLLRDPYSEFGVNVLEDRRVAYVQNQSFKDEYQKLRIKIDALEDTEEPELKLSNGRALRKKLKSLIKQHLIREVPTDGGRFYVNVSPGSTYYLVAVKKRGLFGWNKPIIFWIEELTFEPGTMNIPRKILFDDSNLIKI